MKIGFRLVVAGTVVVGLAIGAGIGALQASSNAPTTTSVGATGGAARSSGQIGSAGSPQQSGGQQQGAIQNMGRPTMGVVEKVGTQEISLKEEGSTSATTVRINDKTTFRKQGTGVVSDIKKGDRIVVRGEAAGDDSVKATSVQILSGNDGTLVFGMGMQPGGPGGQRRQGPPSGEAGGASGQNASIVMGVVESIEGNTITVTQQGGMQGQSTSKSAQMKVSVSDGTTITKTVDGSLEDVKEGTFVTITGPRGADGVIAATSVQILPQGSAPTIRRGQP